MRTSTHIWNINIFIISVSINKRKKLIKFIWYYYYYYYANFHRHQLRDEQRDQSSGNGSAETSGQWEPGRLAGPGCVRGAWRPTGQHLVGSGRERFSGARLPHPDGAPHPPGDPKGARMERCSSRRGRWRSKTTTKRWDSRHSN